MIIYAIQAYSLKNNQTQRELDEDALKGRHCTDLVMAQRKAESFATRLNQQQLLKSTDWEPRVEAIEYNN
jgi:hypothetical protein